MNYTSICFLILSVVFFSCSDDKEELISKEKCLVGYWAITHIKTTEHIGNSHSTEDKVVPPHGIDSYVTEEKFRYDVLIFDDNLVTVRGDMPNRPKRGDYDDSLDGEIEYCSALENWGNNIGQYTDQYGFPVGPYSICGGDLVIGTLNMGSINFISDDEFTLDYNKSLNGKGDYCHSTYTYSRIYSLLL